MKKMGLSLVLLDSLYLLLCIVFSHCIFAKLLVAVETLLDLNIFIISVAVLIVLYLQKIISLFLL